MEGKKPKGTPEQGRKPADRPDPDNLVSSGPSDPGVELMPEVDKDPADKTGLHDRAGDTKDVG